MLECWRCLKKLVPNVWKLVLSYVPVERGVLYLDVHCFFNGPGLAVDFLVNYTKLVGTHGMDCGGTVEVYGGRGLEVFLYSVSQCSAWFTSVRTGPVHVRALVVINDACLVGFGVLVLGVS